MIMVEIFISVVNLWISNFRNLLLQLHPYTYVSTPGAKGGFRFAK